MKTEQEKLLEKATPSMIASMLWKEKDHEYTDIVISADAVLPDLDGLIEALLLEHIKDEEVYAELMRYLEDYRNTLKELYFYYGIQTGARLLKELAFG